MERLSPERLRPTIRQRAWMEFHARPFRTWWDGLSPLAALTAQAGRPPSARHLYRSLLSTGRRVQQRHEHQHAADSESIDAIIVGSELYGSDMDQRQGEAYSSSEILRQHVLR